MNLKTFFLKYKQFFYLFFVFVILFGLYGLYQLLIKDNNETIPQEYNTFKNKHYMKLFQNTSRNAAGPQIFNEIVKLKLNTYQFKLYNTFYCGVSGSLIDPNRSDSGYDIIQVKDRNGEEITGKYYRCCSPCLCDVMKYALVENYTVELEDGSETFQVLTMNDPCKNQDLIPSEVESFQCLNESTQNGLHTESGRLIFALFHQINDNDTIDIHTSTKTLDEIKQNCEPRNQIDDPNELIGGMGDIFVKLATIEGYTNFTEFSFIEYIKSFFTNNLTNIYGEPLQICKTGTKPGSWDKKGYCSELDGGVHQICMNVTEGRSDFSIETGQSDWSKDRVGNNHCMCLGAWALYKKKGKGDGNELVCDSIPEMALNSDYINKWNTWNGNELPDQIINGVDSLVEQCYNKKKNDYLKQKYDTLRNSYPKEWKSII